ncbi:MAG: tRNA-dihydrouridine synthase family protein [Bacteroidales bacterium]|jgi:tRNA-dihydrouridine synthase|nr:tRNA-dihydrouridine synthase family protein [Bacteroidales bacterium]
MGNSFTDTLILAPMHGLTGFSFRNPYDEIFPNSFSKAITPFISLTHGSMLFSKRKYKDVLPQNNTSNMEIIPQVLGNDAYGIRQMAIALKELGYKTMNWNLGCPYENVIKKQRGAALINNHWLIERICKEVNEEGMKISLKLRLGNEKMEVFNLIDIINSEIVDSIILHPRLAKDKYEDRIDLFAFEEFAKRINKPLTYNGDIFTREKFLFLKEKFPQITEWMIGRGVLYDPFLPYKIKGIPFNDSNEKIILLLERMIDNGSSIDKIKEYFRFFYQILSINEKEKERILKIGDIKIFVNTIKEVVLT